MAAKPRFRLRLLFALTALIGALLPLAVLVVRPPYTLSAVTFVGNNAAHDFALKRVTNLDLGATIRKSSLRHAEAALAKHYHALGFPNVRINSTFAADEESHAVAVTFVVREGLGVHTH